MCFGNAGYIEHNWKKTPTKLPFIVRLKEYNYLERAFTIEKYISKSVEDYLDKVDYPFFELNRIKPVFFIDGFDEVAGSISSLAEYADVYKLDIFSYPFVVTTRKSRAPRDMFDKEIKLTVWDNNKVDEYVQKYAAKVLGPEKYAVLKGPVDVIVDVNKLIHSNPLLLNIFLFLFKSKGISDPSEWLGYSKIKLLKECIEELAKRELTTVQIKSLTVNNLVEIWSAAAWEIYLYRLDKKRYSVDKLITTINTKHELAIDDKKIFSSLFDMGSDEKITGLIYETVLEYLVAFRILKSCSEEKYPYPDCLESMLKPEIHRFIREMWSESDEYVKKKHF